MRSLPWVVAAVLLLLVPACGDPEADVAGEGARRTGALTPSPDQEELVHVDIARLHDGAAGQAPDAEAARPVRGRGPRGGNKKKDVYEVDASVLENAGRIEGLIRLESKPELRHVVVDKDVEACGHTSHPSERCVFDAETLGLASCVVTLEGIARGKDWPEAMKPKDRRGALVTRQCKYVPHVQVLRERTLVIVDNKDNALHNLHGYYESMLNTRSSFSGWPARSGFGVGSGVKGHVVPEAFLDKAGKYLLRCDIHPWMNGYFHAVTNPYFAVTDTSGTFALEGVPPGSYTLKIWHEGMQEIPTIKDNQITGYDYGEDWVEEVPVTVEAGQTVRIERSVPPR